MAEQVTGGSAFPHSVVSGMTLRDYFAGQALAGMAGVAYARWEDAEDEPRSWNSVAADIAMLADVLAEAMIGGD